jgi:hypothetical protein
VATRGVGVGEDAGNVVATRGAGEGVVPAAPVAEGLGAAGVAADRGETTDRGNCATPSEGRAPDKDIGVTPGPRVVAAARADEVPAGESGCQ